MNTNVYNVFHPVQLFYPCKSSDWARTHDQASAAEDLMRSSTLNPTTVLLTHWMLSGQNPEEGRRTPAHL